jgi:hypothetical protein
MLFPPRGIKRIFSLLIFAAAIAAPSVSYTQNQGVVRFTLSAGANYGGRERETLRFAVSDARSFSSVLRSMGGVAEKNSFVLVDPDPKMVREYMDTIRSEIDAANRGGGRRTEFIFYYSGHSDEDGLLLGEESVSYKDLREMINSVPADVKIAVLDSCSSGAFTRIKGGSMTSSFMSDRANSMKGFAYMTSSSSDEVSQESERIKGSFFTHYLISGLRGAADMSRDGKVTLNEAYLYAYRETLSRTQTSAGGAQHPNYNIQMNGTGDVVLTETRTGTATLTFGENLSGRVYVNSDPSVVAEINKAKGEQTYLALDSGTYRLVLDREGSVYEANVRLYRGENTVVQQALFMPVKREGTAFRGGTPDSGSGGYTHYNFGFLVFPSMTDGGTKTDYNFLFSVFGSSCDRVNYSSFGLGLSVVRETQSGANFSGIGSIVSGESKGSSIAGVFHSIGGDASGFYLSGAANIVMKDANGMFLTGLANTAGGNLRGTQISAISNIAAGDVSGVQISAITNVASHNMYGAQIGNANIINKDGYGTQIGIVNVSGKFSGAGIGIVNVSGESSGLRLGIVNVDTKSHGVQLGIVNYSSDNDGYPVGILSIVKNGITAPSVNIDETGMINYVITHGNKRVYNLFVLSHNLSATDMGKSTDVLGQGLGIGVRWFPGKWMVATELLAMNLYANGKRGIYGESSLRLVAGYYFGDRFHVYGGVSFVNLLRTTDNDTDKAPITPAFGHVWKFNQQGDHPVWQWFGAHIGFGFSFGKTD